MRIPGNLASLALVGLVAAFAYGLTTLFALRFEEGEMFPPYSSLRSDPLGVKGLYQALERLPGLTTERHYLALNKLKPQDGLTLFYLGLSSEFLTRPQNPIAEQLDELARQGARIVLSFRPGAEKSSADEGLKEAPFGSSSADGAAASSDSKDPAVLGKHDDQTIPAGEKWCIAPVMAPDDSGQEQLVSVAEPHALAPGLADAIPVHSRLRFEPFDPVWRTLYTVDERPVIVERPLHRGSLILVADGYVFSNEAMRNDRSPRLLLWLIGSSDRLVFDELHLGISDRPGVMDLMRKHRVTGFLAALLFLGVLYVWKNAVPLLPATNPSHASGLAGAATTQDKVGRLVHLLRRNIPPKHIIRICYEEWDKTVGQHDRGLRNKRQEVTSLLETAGDDSSKAMEPTSTYNEITRILSERTIS